MHGWLRKTNMSDFETLTGFETRYPFLYDVIVSGVPVYTCLRDHVLYLLSGGEEKQAEPSPKGRAFPLRILHGLWKLWRLRKARTVIFTSAVYRRDRGRNLASEFLMEKYPDAAVFEWLSRNETFDRAYFRDPNRSRICPLDGYAVIYKLSCLIHKKLLLKRENDYRKLLRESFQTAPPPENETQQAAIDYLLRALPESCAVTEHSQSIFRRLFRRYQRIEYAVDFWGGGRENIFPVLPGNPEKIELQHGLISSTHPGYIYPDFVKDVRSEFFKRKLLVYGEGTKKLLCSESIFCEEQIEVTGNPRIQMYKKLFPVKSGRRDLILFTSQPFEQDGSGVRYYETVIPLIQKLSEAIAANEHLHKMHLAIKLHPRENGSAVDRYRCNLGDEVCIYDNTSQLYDLLGISWLHLTACSTVLYEAAEFGVPTLILPYDKYNPKSIFGFELKQMHSNVDMNSELVWLCNENNYETYLKYIIRNIN